MLKHDNAKTSEPLPYKEDIVRRKQFIERMERKLAYKTAAQRRHRQQFRTRLTRMRTWQ